MGGRSYRGDEWKEESQEGSSGRTEARGGRGFPQVSVKGYRGVEKRRGLVILPPFYMESRLTSFFFFLVEVQFSSRLMNSITEHTNFQRMYSRLGTNKNEYIFCKKQALKKINSRLLDS